MTLLMATACGFLVFSISRRIWGTSGGLLSLILYALSPTIMANARLVTSDVASALFFLLSIWSYQLLTEKTTIKHLIQFCVAMTALFLSKMSAPIIIPALLTLLAVRLFRRKPLLINIGTTKIEVIGQIKQTLTLLAFIIIAGSAIFAAIWTSSSFRYSILPNNELRSFQNQKWELIEKDETLPVRVLLFAKSHKILPEYYLYGMAHVLHESKLRHAFLNGKRSETGWWYFFPATFALKTPPALILLFIAGLILPFILTKKGKRDTIEKGQKIQSRMFNHQYSMENLRRIVILRRLAFAFAFITTYVAFSLSTNLNIGHRHLLPIYPPLFIIAGGIAFALTHQLSRLRPLSQHACRTILYLSIITLIIENIMIYPDYLAYFSPIIGGAPNGYKHLVDSSLDWGQDLKRLNTYIKKERAQGEKNIYFAYFGSVNLTAYRLPAKRLLCAFEQFSNDIFSLQPGTYCLSATMLQMDYYPALAEWNDDLEQIYRKYRMKSRELRMMGANNRKHQISSKHTNRLFRDYKIFEKLRFAKLAAHLRKKEPDDNIGHSILIYKLSKHDLHNILK
jgi:hypothetical protein